MVVDTAPFIIGSILGRSTSNLIAKCCCWRNFNTPTLWSIWINLSRHFSTFWTPTTGS